MSTGSLSYFKRFLSFVPLIFLLIFLDQWTKHLASVFLKGHSAFEIVPGMFYFLYVENTGVAFGLFSGHNLFFIFTAFLISLILILYLLKIPEGRRFLPFRFAVCSIISGALGNAIDRLRLGYVVDFIYFKPIDFPVFNFADICVTSSFAVLIFLFIFFYKDDDLRKLDVFKNVENEK